MNNIWIIKDQWFYDCGESGNEVEAFSSAEKANERFEELKAELKAEAKQMNWIYETTYVSAEIYEGGEWGFNHRTVSLEEIPVQ